MSPTRPKDRVVTKQLEDRISRNLWLTIWGLLLFAPTIPVGFTVSTSRFSTAAFPAALYVLWRLFSRPFPSLSNSSFTLGALLGVYLVIHGAIVAAATGKFAVVFLQGEWAVFLLAGLFLAYDIGRTPEGPAWLSSSLTGLVALCAVGGLITVWTGPFYKYGENYDIFSVARYALPIDRAVGTLEVPQLFAQYLLIAFLLEYFGAQEKFSARQKVALGLLFVTLTLTQSKGAIAGCLLAMACGLPLVAANRTRLRMALFIGAIIGIIAGALAWYVSAYDVDTLEKIATDVAVDATDRGDIAQTVINDYWNDDPAPQLFGIGYRQSAIIVPGSGWFTAHNSYVAFLREIGLIGLALLGCFILVSVRGLTAPAYRKWILALLGLLIYGYTETHLYSNDSPLFLGTLGGLVCALCAPTAPRREIPL